ncbi:MAG: hypothetical protein OEW42_03155 [Acidimicrobiia bacterium]|nr:hypothetical protein [Acidimicrobiia bacterium]MDH5236505.1 hypothetical protein [Acidimicrobiia bacterium]
MTDPSPASSRSDSGPGRGVVTAAVTVAIVLVVAAATVMGLRPRPAVPESSTPSTTTVDLDTAQREVGAEFLANWHRWRTIDVVARGRFARQRPDGERLESETVVAQQGDRRLVSRLGGAQGFDGADTVRCVTETDGSSRCDRTPTDQSARQRVEAELDRWSTYLSGSPPFYRIARSVGDVEQTCYELTLTRANPSADFGSVAQFCFADNGVLTSTRIEYANALVETTDFDDVSLVDGESGLAVFAQLEAAPAGS